LDFDAKGMPRDVSTRIEELGGFWAAVVSILPEVANVARVLRRSTSAGLYRTDTGGKLAGSNGLHVDLTVQDGTDIDRFLKTLHAHCWLAGLGWMMVGRGGQLLERSPLIVWSGSRRDWCLRVSQFLSRRWHRIRKAESRL
jgi:hypothetical protein